jgi:hypothetical protein
MLILHKEDLRRKIISVYADRDHEEIELITRECFDNCAATFTEIRSCVIHLKAIGKIN